MSTDVASQGGLDTAVRLKLLREMTGISQRELAKRAGITNSSISMIEQGLVSPSVQSLTRILAAFPISLSDFFRFESVASPLIEGKQDGLVAADCTDGRVIRSLTANVSSQLDASIEHLPSQFSSALAVARTDIVIIVLQGQLSLSMVSCTKILTTGASFFISSDQLFRLTNTGVDEAQLFRCSLFIR